VLDEWPSEKSLKDIAQYWCVAVEVPVVVKEGGEETTIRAERLIDGTVLAHSRVDPEARFLLRAFDIDRDGVEG